MAFGLYRPSSPWFFSLACYDCNGHADVGIKNGRRRVLPSIVRTRPKLHVLYITSNRKSPMEEEKAKGNEDAKEEERGDGDGGGGSLRR